jgi:murein DD-endopeptidase MepM/ murein hydrolase activator NlpD
MTEFKLAIHSKLPLQHTFAQKVGNLTHGIATKDGIERKQAAQEFASFLYLEVLKAMRATLPKEGLFETESLSRDIFSSMFDTEVARVLAKRDREGFTRTVEQAIQKMMRPIPHTDDPAGVPVGGTVSSSFGMRDDPIKGNKQFHAGVDIAAPAGAEIKAASDGKVTFSGKAPGYGNMVEIDHGEGMVTRYAHNAANLVFVGQQIRAGQPIAMVGATGRATGSHLHFELRQGGRPVDPTSWIGAARKGSKISALV